MPAPLTVFLAVHLPVRQRYGFTRFRLTYKLPCCVKKNRLNSDVQPPKYCQQAVSTKSPIQRGVAALTGLKGLTYTSSSLKARMASQGRDGIGEIYQYVPAYAGLRRCYSCTICNYIMPPYMRYAHMKANSPHQTVFGSSVRHSTSARVFSSAHQWHTFWPYLSGIIAHTSLSSMG